MNAIKRNIPNIITLTNLFCGLCAIIFAFQGNLPLASFCIFAGAFFDFFDGLAARLLKVTGKLGKQLDSMADMVTFGVAPGMILFQLIYYSQTISFFQSDIKDPNLFPAILAFLLPIFSAIRLAKFNIDTKQTSSFIGLPTPAAAIFIASLPIIETNYGIWLSTELLIVSTIILSLLLVANLPLFSLKMKKRENWKNKENIIRIIFLISCLILLFIFEYAAIPFIVILYIFLSIINNLIK